MVQIKEPQEQRLTTYFYNIAYHIINEAYSSVTREHLKCILPRVTAALKEMPNVIKIPRSKKGKVNIIGDLHNTPYFLDEILERREPGEDQIYLMNGNLLDDGYRSNTVITKAFALRFMYPNHFFILRGKHESRFCAENTDSKIDFIPTFMMIL